MADYFKYMCKKYSTRTTESLQQRIRFSHTVNVPGCLGDPNDRGQPQRFEKWYKLPKAAHRIYWKHHKKIVWRNKK